jgi:malonate-semialdehyde dehydrogenase (acetylating)/methylmalonate-semialdehyde dehydrogenase
MGPVVNQGHKDFVLNWIETAIKEGAKLILDGRNPKVSQQCEKGFFDVDSCKRQNRIDS